jgi:hypothetical protein
MRRRRDELCNLLAKSGQFSAAEINDLANRVSEVSPERLRELQQILNIPIEAFLTGYGSSGPLRHTASVDPKTEEPHSFGMDEAPNRSEVAAQIAAAEARTDTKFAELRGDLQVISQAVAEVRVGQRATHALVIGPAIAAVAAIISEPSFGATWFGLGINTSDIAQKAADQAVREFVAKVPLNH